MWKQGALGHLELSQRQRQAGRQAGRQIRSGIGNEMERKQTVWMLPDIFGFKRIEDVLPAQQTAYSTGCGFDLVGTFGGEFLS